MTDLFEDAEPPVQGAPESRRGRRDSERAERRERAHRSAQRRRTALTFLVMLIGMTVLVGGGWIFLGPIIGDLADGEPATLADYPGPGSGSVEIVISSGDSGAAIGATLVEADVVATVDAFVAAFNANPDAGSIQPGTYVLTQQIPATAAVAALLNPSSRADDSVTIPEGWRASQVYERMAEVMSVPVAEVEAAAATVELPAEAAGSIEGWLFPSTYVVAPDTTATSMLTEMVDTTISVLQANDIPQETWHDVIIKASIVEKEVVLPQDRAMAARVIENRLAGCTGDGFLGMDTTLVYDLGKPASEITATEWGTASPYNGRAVAGLPPTAISSPSENAIQAAAAPTAGDWCYFVTVNLDTGETKFTADYEEFLVFRAEYQQWEAEQGSTP